MTDILEQEELEGLLEMAAGNTLTGCAMDEQLESSQTGEQP